MTPTPGNTPPVDNLWKTPHNTTSSPPRPHLVPIHRDDVGIDLVHIVPPLRGRGRTASPLATHQNTPPRPADRDEVNTTTTDPGNTHRQETRRTITTSQPEEPTTMTTSHQPPDQLANLHRLTDDERDRLDGALRGWARDLCLTSETPVDVVESFLEARLARVETARREGAETALREAADECPFGDGENVTLWRRALRARADALRAAAEEGGESHG